MTIKRYIIYKLLFTINFLISIKKIRSIHELKFIIYAFLIQVFHPFAMSQSLQDVYACYSLNIPLIQIFSKKKSNLFYVEIGGSDPVIGSNSFLFEKMGAKGIIIEASKESCYKISQARKCIVLNELVSDQISDFEFVEFKGNFQGLSGVKKNLVEYNNMKSYSHTIKNIRSNRLQSIFEKRNIEKVDFLSIDVEGHEMEVLKGIDFIKTSIRVITVEYNYDNNRKNELINYLESKNFIYYNTKLSRQDLWFTSGKPLSL